MDVIRGDGVRVLDEGGGVSDGASAQDQDTPLATRAHLQGTVTSQSHRKLLHPRPVAAYLVPRHAVVPNLDVLLLLVAPVPALGLEDLRRAVRPDLGGQLVSFFSISG